MRVAIIGCGAIGSLFAAHLAAAGECEVWAYDLDAGHVAAINERGLQIVGRSQVLGRPRATTDPAELPPCELGIVATKALHTEAAIAATAPAFAGGAVCSVQNGVGNEEVVAGHVARVIRGTTFPAGHVVEPGVVEQDTGGQTTIGPFEPAPAGMDEVQALAGLLNRAGMEAVALADARGAQWTKVIFNAATNPIGALTGLAHGPVCDQPQLRALVRGLLNEGKAVAAAQGITLDSDPDALVDHAREVAYHHRASMLQDVAARRRTEIDVLNGGLVRFGRELGVPTPLNEAILALILGLEAAWKPDPDPQERRPT